MIFFFMIMNQFIVRSQSAPIEMTSFISHHTNSKMDDDTSYHNEALKYLEKFGYLDSSNQVSASSEQDAIREFQHFAQLNQSGILDDPTIESMKLPRCGVKDFSDHNHSLNNKTRHKRFTLFGGKWHKKNLTYRITKYSSHMKRNIVEQEIAKAFRVWSRVSPLNFEHKTSGKADIELRFVRGLHSDGVFDGPSGVLAHAASPTSGGDVCFDDAEPWSVKLKGTSVNLWDVASHELGHSLGLGHSNARNSLMAPFYSKGGPRLQEDDIKAIHHLYGRKNQAKKKG